MRPFFMPFPPAFLKDKSKMRRRLSALSALTASQVFFTLYKSRALSCDHMKITLAQAALLRYNYYMIHAGEFKKFKKVVLAVSGGRDSMCLLHYFIAGADKLPPFSVLNFEHGLRGEESRGDSDFVKAYCEENGVECRVLPLDCRSFCRLHGYGIEQGARILRRREFERIVKEGEADRVLTAHHADDNAESILMHIFRGSGLKGLCGIPRDDGVVYRPLVDMSAATIARYAEVNKVPYREDTSNADTGFTRNFVRRELLPVIEKRFPNARKGIAMLGERALQAYAFIAERSPKAQLTEYGAAVLPLSALEGVTGETAVFEALGKIGGRVDVTSEHIAAIFALAESESGAIVCLPSGFRACKAGDEVHFYRETPVFGGEIPFAEGAAQMGEYCVRVWKEEEEGALMINADAVPAGAVWRTRREGDRFLPFGGGRRSLGDWMTDKKIPRYLRPHLPVLACGSEIYVVAGWEISQKLKVGEGDKRLYITTEKEQ